MNRKVYLLAAVLFVISVSLTALKVQYGGHTMSPETSRHLWRVNITMNVTGKGERAKVRLTLPQDTPRQTIYNEHFENAGLTFYVRERSVTGNRIGFWRAEIFDASKTLEYTFSAQLKGQTFVVPSDLRLPKDAYKAFPQELHTWLNPSEFIQSESVFIKRHLNKIIGREKKVDVVVKKIYEFVRGEVKYKSEKGSKDAKETLKQLTADCGGKARLFAALARAAGVPTRVVGGIILKSGAKNITHVWVEAYLGAQWVPFDVVNGNYASIPDDYLEIYRGDYYLFKHVGLKKFNYLFFISKERIPPVDNPWSLYALPVHFQGLVKVLLLIPVGALLVALFRGVVGVPTLGTFTPILLALAFREITLGTGLLCLGVILVAGWGLRAALDHLKILVIPRLSIIVSAVVILVLLMMVAGYRLGQDRLLYVSLMPFVIMTWTIERFSVLQIEDGTATALKALFGTLAVAVVSYYVIAIHSLRAYLFAFPEALFIIMALLLLLGRYTGIRAVELWRFREFRRMQLRGKGK